MKKWKCPPGCSCGKHFVARCEEGCSCGKHTAQTLTVPYFAAHRRVYKARGNASGYSCVSCPRKALDWAQTHGTNGDNPEDYRPMCRSCHVKYDMTDERREKISRSLSQALRMKQLVL